MQEEEQAALDDEAERRRKRVQAWQEQKANALALEEAAAQEAAQKAKGWSLEDDLDEVSRHSQACMPHLHAWSCRVSLNVLLVSGFAVCPLWLPR